MSNTEYGLQCFGMRNSLNHVTGLFSGTDVTFQPVSDSKHADLALIDTCWLEENYTLDEPPAFLSQTNVPKIIISMASVERATSDSLPSRIASWEKYLTTDSRDWCVLRPAAFGQELAWSCRYLMGDGLYMSWNPNGAPWVDVGDLIDFMGVLMESPKHWNAAYDVTGPDVVTLADACTHLYTLNNRDVFYVPIDKKSQVSGIEKSGHSSHYATLRADYMDWTTSEVCRSVSPLLAEALGRPATPLSDYFIHAVRAGMEAG